ncbi:MAG: transketolase [Candidatus Kapabacteria bacterium]|nr:transketolase [Candidatus Kapabacteria bacterium]
MTHEQQDELEQVALRVREHIVRMSTNGGCFIGASLSCADLLVYLYWRFLNISPETVNDEDRDVLLLSKGHDVPALYGVLAERGFISKERLAHHLSVEDIIYWHPNRGVSGVEFHSGSLGHLLSVGMGMALDARMKGLPTRVVVILGDGELNEGSVWEACLVASALSIDNLVAIVDRNHFQANLRTEDLIPLEPLSEKFRAFGWDAMHVNGHDMRSLDKCFGSLQLNTGRPTVVIADTRRGKGLPSIEEQADRWFCNFSADETDALLDELNGNARATITSERLIVR